MFKRLADGMLTFTETAGDQLQATSQRQLSKLQGFARRYLGVTGPENQPGVFARTWPIGTTALWIAVLLTVYVLDYFIL